MVKRKKRKNLKLIYGSYGEVSLCSFKEAGNVLRSKYKKDFPNIVILLNFNAMGKNFVFQSFQSYPLSSIILNNKDKSILFRAEWESSGGLKYFLPKSFFEIGTKKGTKKIDWEDISDFGDYQYDQEDLKDTICQEDLDYIEPKIDTKIDSIKSVNMYSWGFEIIGKVISMIAIKRDYIHSIASTYTSINLDTSKCTFNFAKTVNDKKLLFRWSEDGYEPIIEENIDIDAVLFKKKEDKKEKQFIKNFGQFDFENIILED